MIVGVTGAPGSGKSLYLAEVLQRYARKFPIYTNLNTTLPAIRSPWPRVDTPYGPMLVGVYTVGQNDEDEPLTPWDMPFLTDEHRRPGQRHPVVVVIDEVSDYWDALDANKLSDNMARSYFKQHRKFRHAVVWSDQCFENVYVRLRRMTRLVVYCHTTTQDPALTWLPKAWSIFRRDYFTGTDMTEKQFFSSDYWPRAWAIRNYGSVYDTRQMHGVTQRGAKNACSTTTSTQPKTSKKTGRSSLWRSFLFYASLGLLSSGCVAVRPMEPLTWPPSLPQQSTEQLSPNPAPRKTDFSTVITLLGQAYSGPVQPPVELRGATALDLRLGLLSLGNNEVAGTWEYSGTPIANVRTSLRIVRAAMNAESIPTGVDASAGQIESNRNHTLGTPVSISSQATRSELLQSQDGQGDTVFTSRRVTTSAGLNGDLLVVSALVPGHYRVTGQVVVSAFTSGVDTRTVKTDVDVVIPPGRWYTVEIVRSVDASFSARLRGLGLRAGAGADALAVQIRFDVPGGAPND